MRSTTFLFVALLLAAQAFAQTAATGAMKGQVIGPDGPVVGATVEARSSALQGVRTEVTDGSGSFRFGLLPPGTYELTASLSGFGTVTQRSISVGLGHTVSITARLRPKVSEEVTVVGNAPVIDVTSTVSGINITTDVARSLPLSRSYTSVANIAPGSRPDDVGHSIYGSTGAENQFVVDGLNVTGLESGISNKDVSLEFVQELEVMTGGLPAEYGRMTGGIIRAITKSGSNDLKGDAFGYTTSRGLIAQPKFLGEYNRDYSASWQRLDGLNDYGFDAGGPIVRDRVWAFGAFDRTIRHNGDVYFEGVAAPGFTLAPGDEIQSVKRQDLQSAKLTLAINSNQTITASMFGDPGTWSGLEPGRLPLGPPETWRATRRQGARDYVGRYSANFLSKLDVNALAGETAERTRVSGMNGSTPVLVDNSVSPRTRSGGLGAYSNGDARRDVLKLDTTMFLFEGRHAIGVGVDQERQYETWVHVLSGGDRIQKQCSGKLVSGKCPADKIYYEHTTWINDISPAFNPKDPSTYAANAVNPLVTSYRTVNRSFYVQDSWTLGAVTVNAGFRMESQRIEDRRKTTQLELRNPAPRIGAVWDPQRNGRSRIYGFFGRYFESVPMSVDGYFGGLPQLSVRNLSPEPHNFTPDPRAPPYFNKTQYYLAEAAYGVTVDPDAQGQYLDEYLLGYDRQLGADFTAGIRGSVRTIPMILENVTIDPNVGVIVANPGKGMARKISFVNGELIDSPRPFRRSTAVELHASRRFSGNSQFFASYVWSRLYGNYEGLYQGSTQELTPNAGAGWDYADFMVNSHGPLPADRTHQLKAYGSYEVPKGFARGLTLGAAGHWYSGVPLAARGLDYYWYTQSYLTPPGSLGRGPADYEADLHIGYPISFGRERLELLFDVFNVINRQGATILDTMYNSYADGPCGGVPEGMCDPDTGALLHLPGTLKPVATLPNPKATATNPHFLRGDGWTAPRQIRLGARLRF